MKIPQYLNWTTHPQIQSPCAASWETDWLRTAISILRTGFDFSIEWVDHCTSTPVFCPVCVISTPKSEKYRHRISFINSNTKKNKLVKIAKLKTNIINQADILEHIETFIPPKKTMTFQSIWWISESDIEAIIYFHKSDTLISVRYISETYNIQSWRGQH